MTYFKYEEIEEGYCTGEHLLDQITKKAPLIAQVLYPGYELLFTFNNVTSYFIYAKDVLQIIYRNKKLKGQQLLFYCGWYMPYDKEVVSQEISTVVANPSTGQSNLIQKRI